MHNADLQDLIQCPYDKHHQILRHRMQVHLTRCRRNHTNAAKVTCPFNVTHVLNKQELEFHVSLCPERKTFEMYKNTDVAVIKPTIPPPMPLYHAEENWDDEDAPTYNPREHASNADVIRHIQGVAPAERKKFRQNERLRLLEFNK